MREGAAQRIPMQRSFARDRVVCTSGNDTLRILSQTSHLALVMFHVNSQNVILVNCVIHVSLNYANLKRVGNLNIFYRLGSLGSLANYFFNRNPQGSVCTG